MRLTFIRGCLRIIPVNDVLSSLISIGGWIGAAELLVAYFLVSKGTISGDSLKYQALNITGSVLLTINCASSGAWPSVIANAFYLLVGINILFTVKRAYIAQLSRRQKEELRSRMHLHRPPLPRGLGELRRAGLRALAASCHTQPSTHPFSTQ